jgi:hypothetical protein
MQRTGNRRATNVLKLLVLQQYVEKLHPEEHRANLTPGIGGCALTRPPLRLSSPLASLCASGIALRQRFLS